MPTSSRTIAQLIITKLNSWLNIIITSILLNNTHQLIYLLNQFNSPHLSLILNQS